MTDCTCPADGRTIDRAYRVYLYEPTAEVLMGGQLLRDASKVHIYHKACPVHGYKVLKNDNDK